MTSSSRHNLTSTTPRRGGKRRPPHGRLGVSGLAALAVAITIPATASAEGPAVPYVNLGVGVGSVSGSRVIVTEVGGGGDRPLDSGAGGCCPESGVAMDLRLGVKLFGAVGIEGGMIGQGWGLGSGDSRGGTGFVGGGVRAHVLGLVELATDPLEFPVDLSIGFMAGYTILGKDFAFDGSFVGFDATLEWKAADFFTLGARANYMIPNYNNFIYTDYNKNVGRCADSGGLQIIPTDGADVHTKGAEICNGSGPSASFFSPQLVAIFLIDVF